VIRARGREHPQIAFDFTSGPLQPSYGDTVDLTVYRCTQEAMTNAIRHAGASKVAIVLGEDAGMLALAVDDDGRGIDPAAAPGYGLRGMQERVQGLGGRCSIDSVHGRGASIRIAIPLRPAQQEPGAA